MIRRHSDNTQFCLSVPNTSIGSEGCDLTLQGASVAAQHCIIEKRSPADFVLHDLGTSDGTFVNNCRVSGASVRLTCGDIISLGTDSPIFTFVSPCGNSSMASATLPHIGHIGLRKAEVPLTPSISGVSGVTATQRPNSAPLTAVDLAKNPKSSAIFSGRSTMKRNVLNGIVGEPTSGAPKTDIVELLQQTVTIQENKLNTLTRDLEKLRSEQDQSEQIAQLSRQMDQLTKTESSGVKSAERQREAAIHAAERQRTEAQTANHVAATLQRETHQAAQQVSELSQQLQNKEKEGKEKTGTMIVLRRQLAEKDAELRHCRSELTAMKVRPDQAAEQNLVLVKENKNLRKSVRDAKRKTEENSDKVTHLEKDLAEVQTKLQHEMRMHITSRDMVAKLQGQISESQKLERLLEIECKEAQLERQHFQGEVVLALAPLKGDKEPLVELEALVKRHQQMAKELIKTKEELVIARRGYEDIHSHLSRFELDTLDLMECLQSVPLNLAKQGDRIASLELPQNLAWLQGMVLALVRTVEQVSKENYSKASIAESVCVATGLPTNTGVENVLKTLQETTLRLKKEKDALTTKLTDTVDSYEAKLIAQHSKQRTQHTANTADLKRLHEEQMRALYEHEQKKQHLMVEEHCEKNRMFKAEIDTLRENSELQKTGSCTLAKDNSELHAELEGLNKSLKTSAMIEESLRDKISTFDNETASLRGDNANMALQFKTINSELQSLREQNRQYAVTIVTMEQKLYSMSHKYTNMETELNTSLSKIESMPPPPPLPFEVMVEAQNELKREVHRLTTLSNTLRREYGLAKAEADQRGTQVQGLRCDLAGAAARLSDMAGELSEGQKLQLEELRSTNIQHESVIAVQKETIDVLSDKIEALQSNKPVKLERVVGRDAEKTKEIKERIVYKEKALTAEVKGSIEVGRKCMGERHEQIIERQRVALGQLRSQLTDTSTSGNSAEVEQVMMLKKELGELRAVLRAKDCDYKNKQTLLQSKADNLNGTTERTLEEVKGLKGQLNDSSRLNGHNEACFSGLVSEVRSALKLAKVTVAPLSISQLDEDLRSRAQITAVLHADISALHSRLGQKNDLLTSYEGDINAMRSIAADEAGVEVKLLKKKYSQVEDESNTLRLTITALSNQLEEQQRLNNALANRNFSKKDDVREPLAVHDCSDVNSEAIAALKKQHNEQIKRKNYDIKRLKEELQS